MFQMNVLSNIWQWLSKNSKWLLPIAFNLYEFIARQIKKHNGKDKPCTGNNISVEAKEQDMAQKENN
jgi:hypothetical protein